MKLKTRLLLPPKRSDDGFTLIESLLAVIIIAILLIGVAPIVAFSAATRVQAKRVENGLQAARGFMGGVATNTIDDPPINQTSNGAVPVALQLGNVDVPNSGTLNCPTANDYCVGPVDNNAWALYCVDQDGGGCTSNSPKDLVIQAFGLQAQNTSLLSNFAVRDSNPEQAAQRPNAGYQLGIRVYRANSFGQNPPVQFQKSGTPANQSKGQAQNQALTVTTGLGARELPLVEMTTEVATGDTNYEDYCQRLNTGQQGQCNQ